MRVLFASFASEHLLITATAYVSLFLTVALVLWFKFADLAYAIWSSFKNAIRELLDFTFEIRQRLRAESQGALPEGARSSLVETPAAEYPRANRSG